MRWLKTLWLFALAFWAVGAGAETQPARSAAPLLSLPEPLEYDEAAATALTDRWWQSETDEAREAVLADMETAGIAGVEAVARILEGHRRPENPSRSESDWGPRLSAFVGRDPALAIAVLADRIVRPRARWLKIPTWWSRDILPGFNPDSIEPILELARGGERSIRLRALDALELMIRERRAVFELFVALLTDHDGTVRTQAARALLAWAPEAPAPFMIRPETKSSLWAIMTDARACHEYRTAAAAGLVRPRLDTERLEKYFLSEMSRNDNDARWREAAVSGFALICEAPDTVVAHLTPLIVQEQPNAAALFALCEHPSHPDLPIARMFELSDEFTYWRGENNKLFEVAHDMGPRAVPFLIDALIGEQNGFNVVRIIGALKRLGPDAAAAVEPLLAFIDRAEPGDWSKADAVRALNAIAPESAMVDDHLWADINRRVAGLDAQGSASQHSRTFIRHALERPPIHARVAADPQSPLRAVWPQHFEPER